MRFVRSAASCLTAGFVVLTLRGVIADLGYAYAIPWMLAPGAWEATSSERIWFAAWARLGIWCVLLSAVALARVWGLSSGVGRRLTSIAACVAGLVLVQGIEWPRLAETVLQAVLLLNLPVLTWVVLSAERRGAAVKLAALTSVIAYAGRETLYGDPDGLVLYRLSAYLPRIAFLFALVRGSAPRALVYLGGAGLTFSLLSGVALQFSPTTLRNAFWLGAIVEFLMVLVICDDGATRIRSSRPTPPSV